jgi:hypothetical protein
MVWFGKTIITIKWRAIYCYFMPQVSLFLLYQTFCFVGSATVPTKEVDMAFSWLGHDHTPRSGLKDCYAPCEDVFV